MHIISDNDVSLWLKQRGRFIRDRKILFPKGPLYNIGIEIPASSSRSMSLASALCMLDGRADFRGGMFWISTWGIWDTWSTEFGEYVITSLRAQGGPVTPLSNQSGHLLGPDDAMLANALIWQTMLLQWDGFYIPNSADYIVEISHDELCWFVCRDRALSMKIEAALKPWNPQRRDAPA